MKIFFDKVHGYPRICVMIGRGVTVHSFRTFDLIQRWTFRLHVYRLAL